MEITGNKEKLVMALLGQPDDKLFDLRDHKEKRSLTANAYAWVLIGKIADVLREDKNKIYLRMLKQYGQSEIVSVLSKIDVSGYFKYYEEYGRGVINNKDFTHYKVYKGSSQFDTKEMAILIDGIVSEAEELGIETLPPEDISRLPGIRAESNEQVSDIE